MSETILIIRSVSFQHLDGVLSQVKAKWPDSQVSLLTHSHGREAAGKTQGIDRVLVYPVKGDFSFRHAGRILVEGRRFDHLVIPFSNCSGAGFENVLAMAFRIPARTRWTLPLNGDFGLLRFSWWLRFPLLLSFKAISLLVTTVLFPFVLLILVGRLILSRRSGGEESLRA